FLTAVSVSVSAWTLVTISLERFYGICYPLQARRWRSVSHAYICCSAVWLLSLIAMSPVAVTSTLHPIQGGRHKCREVWPSKEVEQVFTMFLLLVLLMVPLLLMLIAYIRIAQVLSQAIREEEVHTSNHGGSTIEMSNIGTPNGDRKFQHQASFTSVEKFRLRQQPTNKSILRRTNQEQFLKSKRRIIKMLTVVVVEFFVCWTPLYVINTAAQWVPNVIYGNLGLVGISTFQLLSYLSSCCNPLTYCFMSRSFRRAFMNAFGCKVTVSAACIVSTANSQDHLRLAHQ
ncbi:unnamed protein product, partial [Meganyctiphanes norvegica]